MLRELASDESAVLEFLLSRPFPGHDELRAQLPFVRVTDWACECGCPSIQLAVDRSAPAAEVVERVPAEAFGHDPTGNLIGVLLFVDDGYMSELEFYDFADPTSVGFPKIESLRHADWSEPDENGIRRPVAPEPPEAQALRTIRNGDWGYFGRIWAVLGAILAVLGLVVMLITGDVELLPLILNALALWGLGVYVAGASWSRVGLAVSYLAALGAIATGVYAMASGADWSFAGINVIWDVVIAIGLVIYLTFLWSRPSHRGGGA